MVEKLTNETTENAKDGVGNPSEDGSLWNRIWPLLTLAVAVFLLFLTVPYQQDIWWSDASRHALDGAFYRDVFLHPSLLWNLRQFAINYYLHYPALSILFYPPMFPVVESVFFGLFGVSGFTALLTVACFYLALAIGAYLLSRRWMRPLPALAVTLLFIGSPEVAFWGRQVMLEIPAYAFLVWGAYLLFRYKDTERPIFLYAFIAVFASGLYTKQTIAFMAPVYAWILWSRKGSSILKERHLWYGAGLFGILIAPLILITYQFGRFNAVSVSGGTWAPYSLATVQNWLFYARQFPSQLGWPTAILAALSLVTVLVASLASVWAHARSGTLRQWRSEETIFVLGWLIVGYAFFSVIALKYQRYTIFILFPLAFFAVRIFEKVLPAKAAALCAVTFAMAAFAYTLARKPAPYVTGYGDAVSYVSEHAPRNSVVLFSGYRDGPFIFDLRARPQRRDLSVLRADKLLMRVAERRERGYVELPVTEEQTSEMLNRYGVTYIVDQPNFWDDLKNMQMLQRVLHSSQFRLVATIPVTSNQFHLDRQLEIYENLGAVNRNGGQRIRMELPLVGASVEGTLGQSKEEENPSADPIGSHDAK
jgi:4-amino-4-deoxy-L-arabinose transferase-like glycosyltransferase